MIVLVVLLWSIYLSDCLARQEADGWTIRSGLGRRMRGTCGPDLRLLDRFGFAWTPLLPWRAAYSFSGHDLSIKSAGRRLDAVGTRLRPVRVAAGALFVWVMLVMPILVLIGSPSPVLIGWAAVAAVIWAAALALFLGAHRHVHGRRAPFETWLAVALSPIALMRAPVALSFGAACSLHPVAAASVLCEDAEFLRIARLCSFDDAGSREKIAAVARDRGLAAQLSQGPSTWDADLSQFCPRCHATYTARAAGCGDCFDVTLQPLAHEPPRPGEAPS